MLCLDSAEVFLDDALGFVGGDVGGGAGEAAVTAAANACTLMSAMPEESREPAMLSPRL